MRTCHPGRVATTTPQRDIALALSLVIAVTLPAGGGATSQMISTCLGNPAGALPGAPVDRNNGHDPAACHALCSRRTADEDEFA